MEPIPVNLGPNGLYIKPTKKANDLATFFAYWILCRDVRSTTRYSLYLALTVLDLINGLDPVLAPPSLGCEPFLFLI